MARILSDFERRLIHLLKEDSRRSITELAGHLGVSRTTVKDKIDQLLDAGIIGRFTVQLGAIDGSQKTGVQTFFHIRLVEPVCKKLIAQIEDWPEIQGAWSISSGELDLLLLISAQTQDHIETIRDKLATHPLVQTMFTTFVLKEWVNRA